MYARFNRGTSPILVSAALSLAVLLAAVGAQIGERYQRTEPLPREMPTAELPAYRPIVDANFNGEPDWYEELQRAGISLSAATSTATSTESDPLTEIGSAIVDSLFGGYFSLKESGTYTPLQGQQLAEAVAKSIQAPPIFTPHTAEKLRVDKNTSTTRMLTYRADMRDALAILITDTEPEFSLFARFLETNDPYWLEEIKNAALRYRTAETNLQFVTTPESAVLYHLRTMNALGAYATTLERLVRFSNDPLATMALLRTYNEDEREMLAAFDALAQLYARSVQNN